ncbi:MAG: hypothetical protein IPJ37_01545 [Bacteroidales bacterium]|nr:hypothetical protein [Bacteroidales bacterium]
MKTILILLTVFSIIFGISVEVFVDGGAFSYAMERKSEPGNTDGFKFFRNRIDVKSLKVYPMRSIWWK